MKKNSEQKGGIPRARKIGLLPEKEGEGRAKKSPPKKAPKRHPQRKMCEAWVTHDPMLSAGAAAVLVCVTVVVYSGALLTAIAGMVLYTSAGTRGTSRFGRASA